MTLSQGVNYVTPGLETELIAQNRNRRRCELLVIDGEVTLHRAIVIPQGRTAGTQGSSSKTLVAKGTYLDFSGDAAQDQLIVSSANGANILKRELIDDTDLSQMPTGWTTIHTQALLSDGRLPTLKEYANEISVRERRPEMDNAPEPRGDFYRLPPENAGSGNLF